MVGFMAIVNEADNGEKQTQELPPTVKKNLEEFQDVLPDDLPDQQPPYRTHQHEIVEEPGSKPTFQAPYRLSPTELADMKKQIEYLLEKRLIRPSTSPYGAPCVVVYLDDILIYSKDMKQHVEHLRRVFEILRRERFYVKLSKIEFALKKVQFLGHMVSAQGVHVDQKKIEAVRTWKTPENVKELQQFLGFANYYSRFVPNYAEIAAPLTNLLKKNTPYQWEAKHQEAVEQLKTTLMSAPVLILPDPELDYVIEADASDQAVGAVLMQDQGKGLQPIAYLCKKLHGAELNYPIHDKEALAIVNAFKAWRCYLEGRKTTVYTNHCGNQ
ncbi:unnamed protein product [Closterium sp. NIES-53]